jgi:hypothetical protein
MDIVSDHKMKTVCKAFTTETCRYLVVGAPGFQCAKNTPMQPALDARVDQMRARGDNCSGLNQKETMYDQGDHGDRILN